MISSSAIGAVLEGIQSRFVSGHITPVCVFFSMLTTMQGFSENMMIQNIIFAFGAPCPSKYYEAISARWLGRWIRVRSFCCRIQKLFITLSKATCLPWTLHETQWTNGLTPNCAETGPTLFFVWKEKPLRYAYFYAIESSCVPLRSLPKVLAKFLFRATQQIFCSVP